MDTLLRLRLLVREAGGKALIGFVTISAGGIDDGVDEIEVTITAYQHITINGVKDVVLTIGVVFAIILRMEAKAQELVVNLLFGGEAGVVDIRLHQYRTDLTVAVLGKTYHAVRTCIEILVVCLDTLEERGEVVIGITEIVQFDDVRTVGREIRLILRPTVEEIAKLAVVAEPTTFLLGPLAEPYQLD